MKLMRFAPFLILLIAVVACQQNTEGHGKTSNDPVLAKVDENSIYQSQLDVVLDRLASDLPEEKKTQLKPTILQGIVRTRVLANLAEQQLSEDEAKSLSARLRNYKDELLVQTYIRKNIEPEPVTQEMVEKYYQDHLIDYTTTGKVNFEFLVTSSTKLDDVTVNKVVDAFSKAGNMGDWKLYTDRLKQQSIPVEYNHESMHTNSISTILRNSIEKLTDGEVSDLVFGEYIYVVRVINREPDILKPLHEVSVDIRKKLAPQKFKQMLTQHIDLALKGINVEYMK